MKATKKEKIYTAVRDLSAIVLTHINYGRVSVAFLWGVRGGAIPPQGKF